MSDVFAHMLAVALLDGEEQKMALLTRIFARTEAVSGPLSTPCLIWQGPHSGGEGRGRAKGRGHSYPRMNLCGCTVAVHRTVWIAIFGPLPSKRQLDHLCKVRRCVNPLHLEPVTHKENQKRKVKNG